MTDEELQEMIDETHRDGDGEVNPHHEEDHLLRQTPSTDFECQCRMSGIVRMFVNCENEK